MTLYIEMYFQSFKILERKIKIEMLHVRLRLLIKHVLKLCTKKNYRIFIALQFDIRQCSKRQNYIYLQIVLKIHSPGIRLRINWNYNNPPYQSATHEIKN